MSPYHRRLDWCLWMAAVGPARYSPWFPRLLLMLMDNDPQVSRAVVVSHSVRSAPPPLAALDIQFSPHSTAYTSAPAGPCHSGANFLNSHDVSLSFSRTICPRTSTSAGFVATEDQPIPQRRRDTQVSTSVSDCQQGTDSIVIAVVMS